MTILITGAAGFIGSHLVDTLLSKKYSIIGLDNFNDYYDPKIKEKNLTTANKNPNFNLIKGSILDKPLLKEIFKKHNISAIIHLAAYAGVRPSIENPELYYETNIIGTKNILDSAKEHDCKRLLIASSSSVYGNNEKVPFSESDPVDNPISPYATTKKMSEIMCYNYHYLYNLEIACLRFFTVYGPRQRPEMAIHKFCSMITNNQPIPVYNHGKCLRDYTYIEDIINGIINILDSPSLSFDIINLGESATISTIDLINLIETYLNKKATLNLLNKQQGDVEKTYADISHAQTTYGYNPQFPIKDGLKLFLDWFNNQ
ncbi:epimerase [Candidatus Marinamargulisbacteria bacterium SCGC AG-333-B06]|nr:epimerase [Candidatus Marinamargulisbacteria bacterium SCGC AG-333-B06]